MNKIEKLQLQLLFNSVVPLFHSRCWICKEPYNPNEAFVFHHRDYNKEEKSYADFKVNGKYDKLAYHKYLIPIILQNPKRFRLIHWKHHYLLDLYARFKPKNFERMVKLSREINRRKFGRREI